MNELQTAEPSEDAREFTETVIDAYKKDSMYLGGIDNVAALITARDERIRQKVREECAMSIEQMVKDAWNQGYETCWASGYQARKAK